MTDIIPELGPGRVGLTPEETAAASRVTLGWLDMLKHEVCAKHPDGTMAPVYVYGLRCGSPDAILRWEELVRRLT